MGATLSVAIGQASVGWCNDYVDRFRDAAAGRPDKPVARGEVPPGLVVGAAVVSLVASPVTALALGLTEAGVLAVALASAWLYNLGLKATWFSWAPYVVSFGLLPVFTWLAARDELPPPWVVATAALLAFAAHLTNVIPDLEADAAAGVRGLPHRLGLRGSLLLSCGLLATQLLVVVLRTESWRTPLDLQGLLSVLSAGLVAAVGWAGSGRTGFHLTIAAVAAMALVLLLSGPA
jgi:4-hydroxybenzoate polyprenyltransferase